MKFNFSIDPDGELDGNDASQEHFTGHRLSSVARELGQNTNDARSDKAKENDQPAVISFKKISVDAKDIPDLIGLKEKLNGSLDYAKNHLENEDLTSFYTKALSTAELKRIPVLRVSDWNTRGLEGPFEGTTPVVAFAKGKGISKKSSKSSGGSRGIGKNAIFTISDLRTLFFSTCSLNKKSNKQEILSQGKAVLISDIHNEEIRKGTGYWGRKGAKAVSGEKSLPGWLKRSGHIPDIADIRGLSLFAIGFNQGPKWHFKLAASALSTFFSAIQQGFLEFQIKDGNHQLTINKASYFQFFENKSILNELDDDEKVSFNKAKCYAGILRDADAGKPNIIVEHFQNSKMGKFRLCILVKDDLPRRVALIRTGMLITESMPYLQRFSGKDFAAVLQARTEKGMEFLRSLEGAEHNALEPDRIDDKKHRESAKRTLFEITKRARAALDKHIKIEVEDSDDIDELAQYFPFELGEGNEDKEKNELNPLGLLKLTPKPIHKPKMEIRSPEGGDEGDDEDGDGNGENENGGDGNEGSGSGQGDKKIQKRVPVTISNVRAVLLHGDATKRRLSFSVDNGGDFNVAVYIAGSDEDESISILNASPGIAENGQIKFVDVTPKSRIVTDIEMSSSFQGALKAYAFIEEKSTDD